MVLVDAIQRAFSVLLLLSFVVGLAVPLPETGRWVVPSLLALVLFLACARITPEDVGALRSREVLGFCAVRFLAVPLVLWGVAVAVAPSYALPLLVFGLLPTGVTTTAIAAILKGNPALALGATLVSTAAAPLLIPAGVALAGGAAVGPEVVGLTVGAILLLPGLAFGVVRTMVPSAVPPMAKWGGVGSVGIICMIALLVASSQRHEVLANPWALAEALAVGLGLYALLYALGLLWAGRSAVRERRSWVLSAGNNNIVLGLSVAVLHLPEHATTFLAWDLAWIVGLSAIQPLLRGLE